MRARNKVGRESEAGTAVNYKRAMMQYGRRRLFHAEGIGTSMMSISRMGFRGALMALLVAVVAGLPGHGALAGEDRVIELVVTDQRIIVPDQTVRVDEGDSVALRIKSDQAGELHLHGYDVAIFLRAGETTETMIAADVAGRFPVTSHGFVTADENGGGHGHEPDHEPDHAVMFYLEVYPR